MFNRKRFHKRRVHLIRNSCGFNTFSIEHMWTYKTRNGLGMFSRLINKVLLQPPTFETTSQVIEMSTLSQTRQIRSTG